MTPTIESINADAGGNNKVMRRINTGPLNIDGSTGALGTQAASSVQYL